MTLQTKRTIFNMPIKIALLILISALIWPAARQHCHQHQHQTRSVIVIISALPTPMTMSMTLSMLFWRLTKAGLALDVNGIADAQQHHKGNNDNSSSSSIGSGSGSGSNNGSGGGNDNGGSSSASGSGSGSGNGAHIGEAVVDAIDVGRNGRDYNPQRLWRELMNADVELKVRTAQTDNNINKQRNRRNINIDRRDENEAGDEAETKAEAEPETEIETVDVRDLSGMQTIVATTTTITTITTSIPTTPATIKPTTTTTTTTAIPTHNESYAINMSVTATEEANAVSNDGNSNLNSTKMKTMEGDDGGFVNATKSNDNYDKNDNDASENNDSDDDDDDDNDDCDDDCEDNDDADDAGDDDDDIERKQRKHLLLTAEIQQKLIYDYAIKYKQTPRITIFTCQTTTTTSATTQTTTRKSTNGKTPVMKGSNVNSVVKTIEILKRMYASTSTSTTTTTREAKTTSQTTTTPSTTNPTRITAVRTTAATTTTPELQSTDAIENKESGNNGAQHELKLNATSTSMSWGVLIKVVRIDQLINKRATGSTYIQQRQRQQQRQREQNWQRNSRGNAAGAGAGAGAAAYGFDAMSNSNMHANWLERVLSADDGRRQIVVLDLACGAASQRLLQIASNKAFFNATFHWLLMEDYTPFRRQSKRPTSSSQPSGQAYDTNIANNSMVNELQTPSMSSSPPLTIGKSNNRQRLFSNNKNNANDNDKDGVRIGVGEGVGVGGGFGAGVGVGVGSHSDNDEMNVENDDGLEMIERFLEKLNININTEMTLAKRTANRKDIDYILYDVWNPGLQYGGQLNISEIGNFTLANGLQIESWYRKTSTIRRRMNMQLAQVRCMIVVTNKNRTDSLEHYLTTHYDTHLDSMNRFNFALLSYVRDLYNFSFVLSKTASWGYLKNGKFDGMIGALVRKQADVGGSPIFFRIERAKVIDYTVRTWVARPCFIFRHPRSTKKDRIVFLQPFTNVVWLLLAFCGTITILLLWLLTTLEATMDAKAARRNGGAPVPIAGRIGAKGGRPMRQYHHFHQQQQQQQQQQHQQEHQPHHDALSDGTVVQFETEIQLERANNAYNERTTAVQHYDIRANATNSYPAVSRNRNSRRRGNSSYNHNDSVSNDNNNSNSDNNNSNSDNNNSDNDNATNRTKETISVGRFKRRLVHCGNILCGHEGVDASEQRAGFFFDSVLFYIGSICQQGLSYSTRFFSGRCIVVTSLFFSFAIYQFYSASIVGTLLMEKPKTIRTLRDLIHSSLEIGIEDIVYNRDYFLRTKDPDAIELYAKKVTAVPVQPEQGYLELPPDGTMSAAPTLSPAEIEASKAKSYRDILHSHEAGAHAKTNEASNWYNPEYGIAKMKKGKFAFHVDVATAYKMIADTFNEKEICELAEIQLFPPQKMVSIVQKGSPVRKIITYGMRRVTEVGLMDYQRKVWQSPKPRCVKQLHTDDLRVDMQTFTSALLVLLFGIGVSLIALGLEIMHHKLWQRVAVATM